MEIARVFANNRLVFDLRWKNSTEYWLLSRASLFLVIACDFVDVRFIQCINANCCPFVLSCLSVLYFLFSMTHIARNLINDDRDADNY